MNMIKDLEKILSKKRVSTNETILEHHSKDESYHTPHVPDVVVFPEKKEEVSKVMAYAQTHRIPVIPFGLGSSLEGHVIPYNGGISMDFTLMNQLIEIREEDFLVRVQPGITRKTLNEALRKYGLFFSVDPGADATLGGMAATNASGTTSVRYGIMKDQVRNLEVVLADGTIMETGSLAAKSSSGYDLNGLFIGSEGTLGCITELTLRVHGIPEAIVAARAAFPTIAEAVEGVVHILSAGIPVARMELVDARSIELVNDINGTDYPVLPTLFMEFHGNKAGLTRDMEFTEQILQDLNCKQFNFERDTKARNQLWEARHNMAYSYIQNSPHKKMMVTDVVLPISKLARGIEQAISLLNEYNLEGGIVGHVGDGNYHTILMIDLNDVAEVQRAEKYNRKIVQFALQQGGSCTGEHGVGIGKMQYQKEEHGPALNIMRMIKQSLDPYNILNPGKVIPEIEK